MHAKICGIKNTKTLKYLINHKYPPKFIGFICNYPKSHRNLNFKKLKELINIKKNAKINYVAVLVLKIVPKQIKKMLAGNIQYNDKLDKYSKMSDIIDISGSLETKGEKDFSKIDIFLKEINKIQ